MGERYFLTSYEYSKAENVITKFFRRLQGSLTGAREEEAQRSSRKNDCVEALNASVQVYGHTLEMEQVLRLHGKFKD